MPDRPTVAYMLSWSSCVSVAQLRHHRPGEARIFPPRQHAAKIRRRGREQVLDETQGAAEGEVMFAYDAPTDRESAKEKAGGVANASTCRYMRTQRSYDSPREQPPAQALAAMLRPSNMSKS